MGLINVESLFGLFLVCFLASSLYPLGSEAFVVGFLAFEYAWFWVWIVATLGNTLGSLTTYGVGYFGDSYCAKHFKNPRFQAMRARIYRYKVGIQNYGFLYALLTFLPILGDVFALALGVYRYSFIKVFVFITIGKGARYLALIAMYDKYQQVF
ncbi:hypothetical protein BCM35_01545 [Helicobacter winghamensis]|uniref:DedA family protein n=1 Tax=Helicobacter winghamensis TaxID=157268 RepID=A0A2N3PLQ6_9HELI|nr:hypothetical protein BCM35_01545 [Helicobacter winghamensis]PKT75274.1 hypothetical protein BCM32_06600 [Helicobacter winghamensis]PKT75350.1 hypothetical protein BCM34_06525 [Helicobacter winghamensis]PKT82770.1 hypothetical protein BCM31_06025 [Helicobacter winghamensis]PKT82906.1 hypothetical protein BCM33_05500 [Helicobacter winghamensis]